LISNYQLFLKIAQIKYFYFKKNNKYLKYMYM